MKNKKSLWFFVLFMIDKNDLSVYNRWVKT